MDAGHAHTIMSIKKQIASLVFHHYMFLTLHNSSAEKSAILQLTIVGILSHVLIALKTNIWTQKAKSAKFALLTANNVSSIQRVK